MAQFLLKSALVAFVAAGAFCPFAQAEESLVTLSAPTEGEKLAAGQTYKAEYAAREGSHAHHVHLFVDGEEVGTAHKLKGSFSYGPLKAGEHKVCAAAVNKGHTPLGAQACATVSVQ